MWRPGYLQLPDLPAAFNEILPIVTKVISWGDTDGQTNRFLQPGFFLEEQVNKVNLNK
jgi:hypothetical protein